MGKRGKKSTEDATPRMETTDLMSKPWFHAAFGCLLGLTVFLSGEQVERSGVFHLPCLLWLLAATVWVGKPLLYGNGNERKLRFSRLDAFVCGFFLLVGASIAWNLLPGHGGGPRPSLNLLAVWLALAAAWFLFRQILTDRKLAKAALAVVLAVVLAEAAMGLYQQFIDIPAMLRQFEANPEDTITQVDPSIVPDTPEWDRLVSRLKTTGPMGTYPMTNTLGGFLGSWLIFLLGMIGYRFSVKAEDGPKHSSFQNAVLLFVTGVVLLCFVLTKCRSAYVGVALGLVLLGIELFRRRFSRGAAKRLIVAGLAALVVLAGVGLFSSGKNVLDGAKRSLGFRLEYWDASLGMIRDYPLFGCGSGNFKQTYTKYKLPGTSEEIADPHNFVVEIAAVCGLPALVLILIPFGLLLWRGWNDGTDETESDDVMPPAGRWLFWGGLIGCGLGFAVSFNGEAPMDLWMPLFAVVSFVVLGTAFFSPKRNELFSGEIPSSLLAITLIVLSVHLLAAGGISTTNTAINFWLLMALIANRQLQSELVPGKTLRVVLAFGLISAMTFIYLLGMRPVLAAKTLSLQAASENRDFVRKLDLTRRASVVDPLSAACRETLATEFFRHWFAVPEDDKLKAETLRIQDEAVRLLPRSAGFRFVFAERLAFLYEKTGDPELRNRALELYREAIERYPNHAKYRAPYALYLNAVAGEDAEKRREAQYQRDEAIRLDDLMTHTDQKLPEEVRNRLLDTNLWK